MHSRHQHSEFQVVVILLLSFSFLLPAMALVPATSLAEDLGTGSRSLDVSIFPHPNLDEDEQYTFRADIDLPYEVLETFTFRWSFGDGDVDEGNGLTAVTHAYTDAGDHSLELVVTDGIGTEYLAGSMVTVKNVVPLPHIDIIRRSTFEDEAVAFSATDTWDTVSDLSSLTYSWTLPGEEATHFSTETSAHGKYSEAGTYSVLLRVKDDDGALGYLTRTFSVDNQPPLAIAGKDVQVFEGTDIMFSGSKSLDTHSDMDSLSYSWDFGDGGTAIGPNAVHSYDESGVYTAYLTVMDTDGLSTRDPVLVTVMNLPPVAKATFIQEGDSSFVILDASQSIDTGSDLPTLKYTWELMDGSKRTGRTVDHTFDRIGTYAVTLKVEDHELASDSETVTITVSNMAPEVTLSTYSVATEDQVIPFVAKDLYDTDGVSTVTWYFGDGTTDEGPKVNHSYSQSGKYTVRLVVGDDLGANTIREKNITVRNQVPKAHATGDLVGTVGEELHLDASGTDDTPSDHAKLEFHWDYGDGTMGHGKVVDHAFQSEGEYEVLLTVTDDDGAISELRFKVRVMLEDFWLSFSGDPITLEHWTDKVSLKNDEAFTLLGSVTVHEAFDGLLSVEGAEVMVQVVESGNVFWTRTDEDGYFDLALNAPKTGRALTINIVVTVGPYITWASLDRRITPTEEPTPVVDPVVASVSTAGISLIAIGAIGGTDIGRWKFFTLMIPLFTRIVKPKVLDHFERGRIYEHIRKNPGDSYSSIRKTLGLKNGSLAHHLRILEMHDYVESRRDGMYKRFYPKGMKVSAGRHKSIQEQIIDLIMGNPRITQKVMAEELGIDRSTVNYHVKILLAMGVIRSEKEGRVKYYYFVGVKDPVPYRA